MFVAYLRIAMKQLHLPLPIHVVGFRSHEYCEEIVVIAYRINAMLLWICEIEGIKGRVYICTNNVNQK